MPQLQVRPVLHLLWLKTQTEPPVVAVTDIPNEIGPVQGFLSMIELEDLDGGIGAIKLEQIVVRDRLLTEGQSTGRTNGDLVPRDHGEVIEYVDEVLHLSQGRHG